MVMIKYLTPFFGYALIFGIFPAASAGEFDPSNSDGTGYSCAEANNYCSSVGCKNDPAGSFEKCVSVECGGRYQKCLKSGTYFWRKHPLTINLTKK
jgi:hypothetical protein